MAEETAAQRFVRDYATAYALNADRENSELNYQPLERLQRLYVLTGTTTPADDNKI